MHSWGEVNRAIFESTKGAVAILDLVNPVTEDFRMLGTWFDGKMSMRTNVYCTCEYARMGIVLPHNV